MSKSHFAPAGLLVIALGLSSGTAQAAASPLSPLAGTWSGGGTLSTSDGMEERLRCRAAYDVGGSGSEVRLNLRCASQSFNFDLQSDALYRGGEITGNWSEATRNASGNISGRASGDHIEASAHGDSFSANLSLTTHGNRQTVSIRPQGANITAVSLSLSRSGR